MHARNGISQSTKFAQTLSTAKDWIVSCTAKHRQCNSSTKGTAWYPTRLLDCGTKQTSETVRLVEAGETTADGPYITLSHCWGHADCLKLTADNHAHFLDQIPMSSLPQLYQDAVYVARHLGVKYLWIDSLCIIQRGDGGADWRREVSLMDQVYSNSFCNISALDAPDSHHSMFCARNPDTLYPQAVQLRFNGHHVPCTILNSSIWEAEVSEARLNTRAWVLQERLLSPRILHFGRSQVFWECRKEEASEVYPECLPPTLLGSSHRRFKDLTQDPHHHAADARAGDVMAAAYLPWTRIVQAYTASSLTFPDDKLVALSAVAKHMASLLQDEYVAGMWRRYLSRELLWSVRRSGRQTGGKKPARPAAPYRSPSWSWAAVDREVNPGLPDVEAADMLIEVEDVQLDYSTEDKTGPLQGGWLRLRRVLKRLALLARHDRDSASPAPASGIDWFMIINDVAVSAPSDSEVRELQPHVMLDAPYLHGWGDLDEQKADGSLYCMPARTRAGDDGSIYILILQHLEDDDRHRASFRRIGLARGWGKDVKEKILARTLEESELPCEKYHSGRHTIRIV